MLTLKFTSEMTKLGVDRTKAECQASWLLSFTGPHASWPFWVQRIWIG